MTQPILQRVSARLRLGLALTALAASAEGTHAQVVSGRVLEDGSGRAVAEAEVSLVDRSAATRARAVTDSTGAFTLAARASGEYTVRVERLGYQPYTSDPLQLGRGDAVSVEILLGTRAIPLQPLIVTARSVVRRGRAEEFYQRRNDPARLGGYFVTREEIDARIGAPTSSLVARVPSVMLGAVEGDRHIVLMSSSVGAAVGTCWPTLYVDGVRVHQSARFTVDDFIDPSFLEGVEVYTRALTAPARYQVGNCGVVLFWTRLAEEGAGWGWKRMAAGAGGIGALVILMMLR